MTIRLGNDEKNLIAAFESAVERLGPNIEDLPPLFRFKTKPLDPLPPSRRLDRQIAYWLESAPPQIPLLDAGDSRWFVDNDLVPLGCRWSGSIIQSCWAHHVHPCEGCGLDCVVRVSEAGIVAKKATTVYIDVEWKLEF